MDSINYLLSLYTVEPPNKGQYGANVLSLVKVVPISEVKNNTLKY